MSAITYIPIGTLRTPYKTFEAIPKALGERPSAEGVIEIDPAYEEGLLDIDTFSHLLVIVSFHLSTERPLRVHPPGQSRVRGVFASRSPHRPNAIGVLTLELMRREGRELYVRGLDVLDGTPVLDIKPYLKHFDCRPEANIGWLQDT